MPDGAKAGEVFLDLSINKKDYNNQLNGIERAAGRIAGRLKAAFAVGSIAAFGKKCLDLGSDLQEVQNVVDVTFTTMSDKVDRFAQEAMTTAGLSETMAKRYVGTFGAMANAFGFSEKEAYRMSTALTNLAGDVASFYNISQDEAYTKLKSVFTGETETLKDLGVVMTQAALDQYALANGYGKTTAAMTEQEKVALRYAFVQSQLANATGDFARTQGSWANQCRILALQVQSAMAAIGQGLINLLTPAIRVINMVMGKVVALANLFRDFTVKIFGDASGEGNGAGGKTIVGQMADDLSSATGAASKLGGAATGAGSGLKSASKSAKELKRTLEGFDQIIKVEDNSKSGSSSGGSGGGGGAGSGAGGIGGAGGELAGYNADIDQASQKARKLSKTVDTLLKKFKRLFKPLKPIASGAKKMIDGMGNSVNKLYKKHFEPMFSSLAKGWKDTGGKFKKVYTDSIEPQIEKFSNKVSELLTDHCAPAFDNICTLVGEVADAVTALYEKALKPLVDWAIENLVPVLAAHFEQMGETAVNAIELIVDIIGGLSEALGGVIEFLTGVFTGDWDTAWEGLKKTADGVLTALLGNEYAVEVKAWFAETAESLGAKVDEVMSGIKSFTANLYATVATKASEVKGWWEERTAEWKDKASAFSNKASTAVQTVKDAWSSRANQWKNKAAAFSNKATTALQTVKDAWNSRAKAWKDKTAEFGIKIKGTVNDIKQWFNKNVIAKVNNAIHKVPLLKNVSIPYLAQGGYVKRNTPQLAMIGDNRHQGEVVAPEDKLAEMARQAAAGAGGYDPRVYELLVEILALLKSLNLVAIDPESLRKYFISKTNQNTKASGGRCELLT